MRDNSATHLQEFDTICEQFLRFLEDGKHASIRVFLADQPASKRRDLFQKLIEVEFDFALASSGVYPFSQRIKEFPEYSNELDSLFSSVALTEQTTSLAGAVSQDTNNDSHSSILQAGSTIGNYEILGVLGRGGMGVVYRARQKGLNRQVALKMIRDGEFADSDHVDRFLAEAEAAAKLDHPGIVPVYEVGKLGNRHFFSMALVEGQSLSKLAAAGPLQETRAAELVRDISVAIEYAHSKGLVHRDLKPGNVMLTREGEPKITDFGLAKTLESDSGLTQTNQILGTPSYMPPEQAMGGPDLITPLADVYSIGAILYRLISGRPPFQSPSPLETIMQVLEREPIPPRQLNPSISRDLETICLKCLEKEPRRRYQSGLELSEELERLIRGEPIQSRPISSGGKLVRWCRRKPLVASLVAAVFMTMVVGTIVASYFAVIAESRANRLAQSNSELLRQSEFQLTLIEDLIIDISDELEQVPAARPARRKILLRGVAGLEAISDDMKTDDRAQADKVALMTKLASIYQTLGDVDGADGTRKAIENFEHAAEIGESLHRQNPDDWQTAAMLANALEGLTEVLAETARYQQSLAPGQRCLEIRQAIVESLPVDSASQIQIKQREFLVWAYRNFGNCHADVIREEPTEAARQWRIAEAREIYEQGIEFASESLELYPDPETEKKLGDLYVRLGDLYLDYIDPSEALKPYTQAMEIHQRIVDEQGDEVPPLDLWDLAGVQERFGEFHRINQDYQQALKYYQMSLDSSAPMAASDPDNIRTQLDFAISHCLLGKAYRGLRNGNKTIESYQNALAIRLPLAKRDPTNQETHRLVINSYQGIAAGHLINGHLEEAVESYQTALDYSSTLSEESQEYVDRYVEQIRTAITGLNEQLADQASELH